MLEHQTTVSRDLANNLLSEIESLISEAEQATRPLEIDPYRSRLFELFVTADAGGFLIEDSDPDLTADGVGRELAQRWGLASAAEQSFSQQQRLPPEHLAKMRMLWSFMRMWLEWTYAWQRWNEFHASDASD